MDTTPVMARSSVPRAALALAHLAGQGEMKTQPMSFSLSPVSFTASRLLQRAATSEGEW